MPEIFLAAQIFAAAHLALMHVLHGLRALHAALP
jgi:hypothetical protein